MSLADRAKGEKVEIIIRFLANELQYGKLFNVHQLHTILKEQSIVSISYRRLLEVFTILGLEFKEIFGYEKIGTYHLFKIATEKPFFKKWFKSFFGTEF